MNNHLTRLYHELKIISNTREVTMMAGNQVSKYNLAKGKEIISKIIEAELRGEINNELRTLR